MEEEGGAGGSETPWGRPGVPQEGVLEEGDNSSYQSNEASGCPGGCLNQPPHLLDVEGEKEEDTVE